MKARAIYCALLLCALAGYAAPVNLLRNPGFESDLASEDWGISWGSFKRESSWRPPEGAYAGFIRGGVDPNIGIIQQLEGLKPGTVYRLSARFRMENGFTAAKCRFKLEFMNENWQSVAGKTHELNDLARDTWVPRAITATAPADVTRAQVVFEAEGIVGNASVASDGWVLEPLTP